MRTRLAALLVSLSWACFGFIHGAHWLVIYFLVAQNASERRCATPFQSPSLQLPVDASTSQAIVAPFWSVCSRHLAHSAWWSVCIHGRRVQELQQHNRRYGPRLPLECSRVEISSGICGPFHRAWMVLRQLGIRRSAASWMACTGLKVCCSRHTLSS